MAYGCLYIPRPPVLGLEYLGGVRFEQWWFRKNSRYHEKIISSIMQVAKTVLKRLQRVSLLFAAPTPCLEVDVQSIHGMASEISWELGKISNIFCMLL